MSVERGTWREAELLDELWRRLDEAAREAIAWEVLASQSEELPEAPALARV